MFFTICADIFCYKLCNMYYKLCNMCYKLSNMRYKLCNKKYLPGKDGCFKQKLAKTATISPAICK